MPMKKVAVSEDGKALETYEIVLGGLNYVPTNQEFISMAKRLMADDGRAANRIKDATFKIID